MPIPQQRDPEDTRARLTAWLREKMPAASDLALSAPAPPSFTGFSNDTLLFDAEWRERGEERRQGLVARIRPSGYAIFPTYDIGLQYRVIRTLAERSDIPVPKVFWMEDDERVLGAPFYVMEKIEGQIPGDNPSYHGAGWVTEIAEDERRALWCDAIDVLARIHRLDWRTLGFECLDDPARGAPGLDQQLHYYSDYLRWAARGTPQPVAEAALAWIQRQRPADEPLALCWGDARIGNMIFRDGRCRAVLDWEMVTLGNPEQDLAWFLFLDRHHSEGIGIPRLAGFPSRAETIARYEDAVGRRVRHLEFYEIFAGFRFAVIMMRVAQMMIEYGVLPPDSDLETNNICTQLLAKLLGLPPPS